ncbi:E3 ubiquitin-protein ligase TRIM35-like [Puntigrus tetrazona]|uniref:E3 ubiquitin-protein ligase TRIM35-like n=1 Tax=Puntigrus tetrazona TaxID=1606681 RepID=UPI001C88F163|nr:E3 ubiquitin-protein ligase TRIM35-like [Puntigrus tetrazona]
MASKRPFSEEDFTCSVCCDIFSDPVLLQCGHSVCRVCVQQYWTIRGSRQCPLCRKRSTNKNPPVNLALKNLTHAFLNYRGPSEELCELHRERLSLFCLHDEELLCVVCRESCQHRKHECRPVTEIAEERKRVFRRELDHLTRKLKILQHDKIVCGQQAKHIPQQVWRTQNLIKSDFNHLRQLLDNEEKAILAALCNEKKLKTQIMEDKMKTLMEEIHSLNNSIRDLKDKLSIGDVQFLKSFKDILERAQNMNQEPETVQGGLIDTAQYLGNLKFTVWLEIGRSISYTPVVLDPNTANSQLIVSEDLTCVRDRDEQEEEDIAGMQKNQLPDNPERFDRCNCVLGSVGYSSGTHIWDVDVGDSTFWMLGVTTESVKRKGTKSLPSEVWCIGCDNNTLNLKAPWESCIPLLGFEKPKRVRVKLDLDEGQLSFSDPLSRTLFHTFTTSYTEKVFPFFCSLCSVSPLRILPQRSHKRDVKSV